MTGEKFEQNIFASAPIGLARVEKDGRWLKVNPQLCDFLGYPAEQLQQMRFHDVTHPDDLNNDVSHAERLLRQGNGSYNLTKRYIRGDGSVVTGDLNVRLLHDDHVKTSFFVAAIQDISNIQKRIDKLEHRTRHDSLTKIANRVGFLEYAKDALRSYQRHGTAFALGYLDLDGFKAINDTFGHEAGDQMLKEVAERLTQAIGRHGLAARMGGDEFAILLDNVTSLSRLHCLSYQLHTAFSPPIVAKGQMVSVTASIGFAHCPTDSVSLETLLRQADREMYASKKAAFSTRNQPKAIQ